MDPNCARYASSLFLGNVHKLVKSIAINYSQKINIYLLDFIKCKIYSNLKQKI